MDKRVPNLQTKQQQEVKINLFLLDLKKRLEKGEEITYSVSIRKSGNLFIESMVIKDRF